MKEEKSAIKEAKFCPCGSVRIAFDMEALCEASSHRETLLEIADILDHVCMAYIRMNGGSRKKKPDLRVIN